MLHHLRRIVSLVLGFGVLQVGHGLLGSLLGVRGSQAGFDSIQLGVVMAGYFVGYLLGSIGAPMVIRRAGHIRAFAALASAASAAVIVHGILIEPWAWFGLRVINGFCMVGLFIVVESWLNQQVPSESRGTLFSIYLTVNLLAVTLGQGLLLIQTDQALMLFGLVSVLMSVGLIPIVLTRQVEPRMPRRTTRMGVVSLMHSSPLGVAGTFASGFIFGAFYSLGPAFVLSGGGDNRDVAVFMATVMAGGASSLVLVGRISDALDRRKVLVATLGLTSVSALGMVASAVSQPFGLLLLAAFGACGLNIYALSASHLHDHLRPHRVLAATSGLQTVYGISAIAGPVCTGLAMAWLGRGAFVGLIAGIALGVTLFGLVRLFTAPGVDKSRQGEHLPGRTPSAIIAEALRADDPAPDENPQDTRPSS